MSEYIHKSHKVRALMYHLVFPAKYRRVVFDENVDAVPKEMCLNIKQRYEVKFLEIGIPGRATPLKGRCRISTHDPARAYTRVCVLPRRRSNASNARAGNAVPP